MIEARPAYFESLKEKVIREGHLSADTAAFYAQIFSLQKTAHDEFRLLKEVIVLSELGSVPAVDPANLMFSADIMNTLTRTITAAGETVKKVFPDIECAPALEAIDADTAQSLTAALLKHEFSTVEEFALKHKTLGEPVIFALMAGLKPLFVAARERHTFTADEEDWQEPRCPYCGYTADFASISDSEDNLLRLHCGLCEHRWKFKRLTCVICGNTDTDTLKYYESETDTRHRLDCCDACTGYIKTFRLPKGVSVDSLDLYVENLISNYIDATAMEMGYRRP